MHANIDKGFLDLLNARLGTSLTWKEFWDVYRERKAQREADPIRQARLARERWLFEEGLRLWEKTEGTE